MMRIFRVAIAVLTLAPSLVTAQDFQTGLTAASSGDYATALREWSPLAGQGNAAAQYNLGVMYENGWGVPQDDAEAVKWYRLAAGQGHATAQNNLGVLYDNGRGVPQDDAEAVKWYRLAAGQGHAAAQNNLGLMYESGEGVPQDHVTAHMWYDVSVSSGRAASNANRDRIAGMMQPADISEAQRRAKACLASTYANCD